jgi:type IV pilus assembly protein PilC
MAYYEYIARSKSGEKQSGRLEASDRNFALVRLEQMGLFPVSIKEATGLKVRKERETRSLKGLNFKLHMPQRNHRLPMRHLLLLSRELSDLLSSGMKLGSALHTLSKRDSGPDQNAIVRHLRDEVVQGVALSDALLAFPETFPPLYQNMITAGETIGALPDTLNSICDHFERVQEAKEKVMMTLLYPGIVLTVSLITLVVMSVAVIPKFSQVFADLGSTLPAPTQMLIDGSEFMKHNWLIMLLLLGGIGYAIRKAIRTEKGRYWWHKNQLKLPILKGVTTANAYATFARTLETLIRHDVPILQALSIVENTMTNVVIAGALREARKRVTDGSSVSGPLAAAKVFPQTLTDMLAVGEESGDLSGALKHISRRYENELDRNVKIFTTVLEPLMILFVAILIGFVAISLMLPIFDISSGLQL